METNEIIKTIKDLLEKSRGSLIKNLIYGKYPDLAEFIKNKTSFMDAYAEKYGYKYTWLERIYCVINNVCNFPKCKEPECRNKLYKPSAFLGLKRGFRSYCSLSCATHSQDVVRHRKENCMEKYGVSNASKIDSVIRKMLSTRNERGSMKHAVEKARNTRFSRNGGKWHADDFGDKVKAGKIANGHAPNWNNIEKRKETLKRDYGVDSTLVLPQIRMASAEAIRLKSFETHIKNCPYDTPEFTAEEYLAREDDSAQLLFRCRKCGRVFNSTHHDGKHRRCPKCWPKLDGVSNSELELREAVTSYAGGPQHVVFSDRTTIYPLELDVCVPDCKLAIEYDGLYWHCDANERITKTYHLEKTESCARKGVRLIHIFEDEWKDKRSIVESRLKNMFGVYDKTVYARKCRIAEVSARESNSFQDETHLQGHVNASVRLGLYFENELVSLMTFGKCRFDKKHEWELLRFCNKLGYHIPGAASKLLKHFEKNWKPKSLVTYADRRWSEGNLYHKLGFRFVRNSPPNYWYVGNAICRRSRIEFQKHKLKDKLKIYDNSKTEVENMRMNGFYRIFDCGNMVFEKEYLNESM